MLLMPCIPLSALTLKQSTHAVNSVHPLHSQSFEPTCAIGFKPSIDNISLKLNNFASRTTKLTSLVGVCNTCCSKGKSPSILVYVSPFNASQPLSESPTRFMHQQCCNVPYTFSSIWVFNLGWPGMWDVMNHLGSTFSRAMCPYGYRHVLATRDSHDATT
jgi:hypothetical protein